MYDYEYRYKQEGEIIQKKRLISGREYLEMVHHQKDEIRRQLEIYRTSFEYEKMYFQLETMTNIIGQPTFLRVESESDTKVPLPPYL